MNTTFVVTAAVAAYFLVLLVVSRVTSRHATNSTFFRAEGSAPWWMVAFGMIGASVSGISVVSVPGMVGSSAMSYLQLCLGFIAGYAIVAYVLLPLYYRLHLVSIYGYLGQRLGQRSQLTASWFFLLSKLSGAAVKFYVVCMILQTFVFDRLGLPFYLSASLLVVLIWLYTRRGGIRTLVFTDALQTLCLLTAVAAIAVSVAGKMGLSVSEAAAAVAADARSTIFVFYDWQRPDYFWKQFISGAFIVVVMTGLDQDMMQKNLTCRSLGEAQKNMCSYGAAFVPVNLLLLALGVLLMQYFESQGIEGVTGDNLLPHFISSDGSTLLLLLFTVGIVAASFSSADSALTSITTIFCIDICQRNDDVRLRRIVHLAVCVLFIAALVLVRSFQSPSLISTIYTLVGYTYGPLLGLFVFGLLTRRAVADRWVPGVCITAPVTCYALSVACEHYFHYTFGYELLLLNGLLTFAGLVLLSRNN